MQSIEFNKFSFYNKIYAIWYNKQTCLGNNHFLIWVKRGLGLKKIKNYALADRFFFRFCIVGENKIMHSAIGKATCTLTSDTIRGIEGVHLPLLVRKNKIMFNEILFFDMTLHFFLDERPPPSKTLDRPLLTVFQPKHP